MLTKYHSLDGKVTKEAAKGKWSLVGAILFTFLGVCAVSQLMHTQASEASVGVVVETAVGPGNCNGKEQPNCKLSEGCSWRTVGEGANKQKKCAEAITRASCAVEGLEEVQKVGVGMECEIQTSRWYSPDQIPPTNYVDLEDDKVKHSCGWTYKTTIGTVYWSDQGTTNDETTKAFDITGEEHCIIELVTPPLTVNKEGAEKTLMKMAILGIVRISFISNQYKDLSLGEVFNHLNKLHSGNKEKADWAGFMGKYRIEWRTPKQNNMDQTKYLTDEAKAKWDTDEFQKQYYPRMVAPSEANPNFEYKPPHRQSGPGKLVWQANVNVPIFFWDLDTTRPQTLSSDAKLKPLSTLSATEFRDRKDKIMDIENPIVRALCALFKNEGLTYANSQQSVLSKASKDVWKQALNYREFPKSTLMKNIPNMKNWQPWLNKAMWKNTGDFEWNLGTEAERVHKLQNKGNAPFLFNEYTYKPVKYGGYPYGVAESRVGDSTLIAYLKPGDQTYEQFAVKVGTFMTTVAEYQDASKYGGSTTCAGLPENH